MVKVKHSVSFKIGTLNAAKFTAAKLGFRDLSHFVDYVIHRVCRNPIEVLREKTKHHLGLAHFYKEQLDDLQKLIDQKVEKSKKGVFNPFQKK